MPTFADRGVSRGQRNGSPRPLIFSGPEPLLFYSSSSSVDLTRLSGLHIQYIILTSDILFQPRSWNFATRLQNTFYTRTPVLFLPIFAIADYADLQVNAAFVYGLHHRGRNISRSMADRINF